MNKVRFETLEKLFQNFDNLFMQTDHQNFYLFNRVVVFKIPKIYMELEMYKYTDEEKINVENDYKKSINCKRLFENTDFIEANIITVAGINEPAIYMERINPFLSSICNLSEITYLFETEKGLLEIDSKYCDFVIDVLQLFSDEKVKKFVNRKNKFLYIENSIAKAAIAPIKTEKEKRRLFVKKFLV